MKYFKKMGLLFLLAFTFYLTDFITDIAINTNSLMQIIKSKKNNFICKSVNATINDNTIVPGIKGKVVNEVQSYLNMKDFGSFNENYLIYDYVEPDISLNNNKDKIIISGNNNKRAVSILINNNKVAIRYFSNNNIYYTKMIKYNDTIIHENNVNIEGDRQKFLDLDTLLNKKKINNNICIVDYSNIDACIKKKYYLVKPSVFLLNNNFYNILNNINNGSIILIDDNLSMNNINLLISYLKSKDLKIVYLSEIIKE